MPVGNPIWLPRHPPSPFTRWPWRLTWSKAATAWVVYEKREELLANDCLGAAALQAAPSQDTPLLGARSGGEVTKSPACTVDGSPARVTEPILAQCLPSAES